MGATLIGTYVRVVGTLFIMNPIVIYVAKMPSSLASLDDQSVVLQTKHLGYRFIDVL